MSIQEETKAENLFYCSTDDIQICSEHHIGENNVPDFEIFEEKKVHTHVHTHTITSEC